MAKPARQSCFSVGVGARQWREIRTIYLRVHLAAGGRIRPHTHPDERNSTVLKGVLYVGFGRIFDESKLVAIPTGQCASSRQCATLCYGQEGDVIYQEAGVGVTGTMFLSEASSR